MASRKRLGITVTAVIGALAAVVACAWSIRPARAGDAESDRVAKLERRIAELEKKLRAAERCAEPPPRPRTLRLVPDLIVPRQRYRIRPAAPLPPGWVCDEFNGLPRCGGYLTR